MLGICYAKAMLHLLVSEIELPLAPPDVFAFFADATNLELITPPELSFSIVSPLPLVMHAGTLIDYRLRLFGVPIKWRTRIASWDPPVHFADEQLRGPYSVWLHRHHFVERNAGTLMIDEVRYSLPLAPWSEPAHPLVRLELRRIFTYRASAIAQLLMRPRTT